MDLVMVIAPENSLFSSFLEIFKLTACFVQFWLVNCSPFCLCHWNSSLLCGCSGMRDKPLERLHRSLVKLQSTVYQTLVHQLWSCFEFSPNCSEKHEAGLKVNIKLWFYAVKKDFSSPLVNFLILSFHWNYILWFSLLLFSLGFWYANIW